MRKYANMFALCASALLSVPLCAAQAPAIGAHVDEPDFADVWSEPIIPKSKRAKIGPWHMPSFPEVHRYIRDTPARAVDVQRQRAIRNAFAKEGAFTRPAKHVRISCRAKACEFVILYPNTLSNAERMRASQAINRATSSFCSKPSCESGMVMSGGRTKGTGLAELGYLIQTDSGFI
ncbi:hypothetical protein ACQKJZ_14170 [Sphingomonas sp. NPDC019816]|uniref:hypothetical protein n=1 Tax=Sphingomonas sp. NPDC019816 TaxID=3390679 RepID=UPI003D08A3C7